MSDETIIVRLEEISRRISDLEREVGAATGVSYMGDVQTRIHRLEGAMQEVWGELHNARAIQSKLGHDDRYRQIVRQEELRSCLGALVAIAVAIAVLVLISSWGIGKL